MSYNTKRYQFELPVEGAASLEEMKRLIGAKTNGDLFDNALTLLDWAITNVRNGGYIASMDANEENYRILTMPALERARKAPPTETADGAPKAAPAKTSQTAVAAG